MSRRASTVAAALLVCGLSSLAHGDERMVRVRVVEVAGQHAYVTPCAAAGLRVGTEVRFRRRTHRVVAVSDEHCAIERRGSRLRRGLRGRARVQRARGEEGRPLRTPVPVSELADAWPAATPPSLLETPAELVPLGVALDMGQYQLSVRASTASFVPLGDSGDPVTRLSLGARLRAEPWSDVPFGIDADAAASLWLGAGLDEDLGAGSRPLLSVSELRLRYGTYRNPLAGLGRLRYAAATLGLLDGVRVRTPTYGGLTLAAFGGTVPDPLDGRPDFDVARFGVEATYEDLTSDLRPSMDLVIRGSRFGGALDERRASARARVFPGPVSAVAGADVAVFDRDNPWGMNRLELTWAGVDLRFRNRRASLGARLDYRQPERSRWLASLLPQSWLCTAVPLPAGSGSEPCTGHRSSHYFGSLDGGLRGDRWAAHGGVTTVGRSDGETVEDVGGFADFQLFELFGHVRAALGLMGTNGDFLDTAAARVAAGAPVVAGIDASLYYRPALISYQAANELWLEHRGGIDLAWSPRPDLDLLFSLEATGGPDVSALGTFATAVWRASR